MTLEEHRVRVVLGQFDHSTTLTSSPTPRPLDGPVVQLGECCFFLTCVTILAGRGELVRRGCIGSTCQLNDGRKSLSGNAMFPIAARSIYPQFIRILRRGEETSILYTAGDSTRIRQYNIKDVSSLIYFFVEYRFYHVAR